MSAQETKLPRCSRCGVVYGDLELKLKFPDGRVGVMVFHHKPGCKWIGSKSGRDQRQWLIDNNYLPQLRDPANRLII